MKTLKRLVAAGVLALALTACGGGASTSGGAANNSPTIAADGENLAFDKAAVTVGQGQVTLAFNNTSGVNQHNWILANGGDDVAMRIDEAALGAENYVPTGADVLAHSRLLNPGENETVTFTAPAAGTYTYLCTVPGHYAAGMKGTLTVQ